MPQDKTFVLLVILITFGFIWILWPFYGAIFWATMLAILFGPMYRRLTLGGRTRRTPAPRGSVGAVPWAVLGDSRRLVLQHQAEVVRMRGRIVRRRAHGQHITIEVIDGRLPVLQRQPQPDVA